MASEITQDATPIHIGSRLELFVDDYLIDTTVAALYWNFKLPRPYRTNLVMYLGGILSALIQIAFAGIGG